MDAKTNYDILLCWVLTSPLIATALTFLERSCHFKAVSVLRSIERSPQWRIASECAPMSCECKKAGVEANVPKVTLSSTASFYTWISSSACRAVLPTLVHRDEDSILRFSSKYIYSIKNTVLFFWNCLSKFIHRLGTGDMAIQRRPLLVHTIIETSAIQR